MNEFQVYMTPACDGEECVFTVEPVGAGTDPAVLDEIRGLINA